MYTKCPSCRSEISFDPPANMENLPDGYKHRIKCPSCGVTIGVKIPKQETQTEMTYKPQNEFAVTPDTPIPTGSAVQPQEEPKKGKKDKAAKKEKAVSDKKAGTGRNIFMMIFSLLFVAINVLAYLNVAVPYCKGFESFNGIQTIANIIADYQAFFGGSVIEIILGLLPAILFVFAGIDFIVAFIAACGKKYGRAFNLIWSLIIAACAVVIVFIPVIGGTNIVEYFLSDVLGNELYGLFIGAGIGILQLLFSLFFLASLKKKAK